MPRFFVAFGEEVSKIKYILKEGVSVQKIILDHFSHFLGIWP